MVIKKCFKCGAIVKVLNDCKCLDCGIECCNQKMKELVPNESDAAYEKHVPEYEINNDMVNVIVNHVMDDDHYIEWISYVYDNKEQIVYFNPGDAPQATFEYVTGAVIYAYCNKHLLWAKVVE